MTERHKAWECLIDIVFNDKKNVPLELIFEFRNLANKYSIENYCDFLRGIKLPEKILNNPWEWQYLEDISKTLPKDIQILILKGGAIRDMELYPTPLLRTSTDLDIFIPGLKKYKEQKDFIEHLIKEKKFESDKDWKENLKKIKNIQVSFKDHLIDIHFDLFSPLGNLSNFPPGSKKTNKILEKKIIESSIPFRGLNNIKKMCVEDLWLYSIFHFLKEYPPSSLFSIIDPFLIIKNNKTTLEKLKVRAKETNQDFLYKIGIYTLSQLLHCGTSIKDKLISNEEFKDLNIIQRKIFNLERIIYADKCSIKTRMIESLYKSYITTNGHWFLSSILGLYYFVITNIFLSTLDEKPFTFRAISNLVTKLTYTTNRFKSYIFFFISRSSNKQNTNNSNKSNIIPSEKKLISIQTEDIKITFRVPIEFYDDLTLVWKEFLTEEHSDKEIKIERLDNYNNDLLNNMEIAFSKDTIHVNLPNNAYGQANTDISGEFFASNYWYVRNIALSVFRILTFKRKDLLLLHSGGVQINGETIIFPGGSTCGKTTFFKLLGKNGIKGINDDTLLLKKINDTWYVYPTPFMSEKKPALNCKESKLTGVIDLIKVCGGHKISPIQNERALAIILNSYLCDVVIDDAGFIRTEAAYKVLDVAKQIKYAFQVNFSLSDEKILLELLNKYFDNPNKNYQHGSNFIRLIELRGNSMEPTFKNQEILKVMEISPDKLEHGDIICYVTDASNLPIVHRVMHLIKHEEEYTVITKGDNNTLYDPPNVFKSTQKVLRVLGRFS